MNVHGKRVEKAELIVVYLPEREWFGRACLRNMLHVLQCFEESCTFFFVLTAYWLGDDEEGMNETLKLWRA